VKGCVEEEGDSRLSPSSTSAATVCVLVLTRAIVPSSSRMDPGLKLCGHRHTIVPGDDIIQNVRVRLSVLLSLYTLNCAVRLLSWLVKASAVAVSKLLLTSVVLCYNNFFGCWWVLKCGESLTSLRNCDNIEWFLASYGLGGFSS